jgi:hypothetical protein
MCATRGRLSRHDRDPCDEVRPPTPAEVARAEAAAARRRLVGRDPESALAEAAEPRSGWGVLAVSGAMIAVALLVLAVRLAS